MMMYPPPPPPSGRHRGSRLVATLLTFLLVGSIFLNVYLLLSSFSPSASTRQDAIRDGDRKQTLAVIPVTGMITAETSAKFNKFITLAEQNPNVKGIVIEIDSPGGTVTASDEIYNRIMQFRKNRPSVPVYAAMSSLAASGGYYVACGATDIYAQPTTITGSIGVLLPNFNVNGLMKQWGIEETTIESTGADFKNAGSMFQPPDPVEIAYLQRIADAMFVQFKSVIVTSRQSKLTASIDRIANGKVYLTDEAIALGLVDRKGYLTDATGALAAQLSLADPNVVRYADPPTLFDMLAADSSVAPPRAGSINVNGVNIDVDLNDLADLTTPRLMYLWRGQ